MNLFSRDSSISFFVFHLIFLILALSNLPLEAQQAVKPIVSNKTLNLSIPLRLCFQKQDSKITNINFASDNFSAVYIPFENGSIRKINLISSFQIWVSNLGGEIVSDLIIDDGKIYLITKLFDVSPEKNNGESEQIIRYILWSLDAETGLTDWQLPFTSSNTVFLNSYRNQLFLTTKDGAVNLINKGASQKKILDTLARNFSSPPTFFEDKIYIGTEDNLISVISVDNGKMLSTIPTLQSPASILAAAKDKLFWGDRKGFVSLFDIKTNNRIWGVRYGGEISGLTLVPNGVLVSSLDNFVYLISLQKGKKIWKRRLAGRIFGQPLIINNFAVFVTSVDNNAVVLDLENGRMVNQISLADIGFILSTPMILNNLLVFTTNKGVFAFADTKTSCTP